MDPISDLPLLIHSGYSIPDALISPSNQLVLIFQSDHVINQPGFELIYKIIQKALQHETCIYIINSRPLKTINFAIIYSLLFNLRFRCSVMVFSFFYWLLTTKHTQIKQFHKYLQQQQLQWKVSLLLPWGYLLLQLLAEFPQISQPKNKKKITFNT